MASPTPPTLAESVRVSVSFAVVRTSLSLTLTVNASQGTFSPQSLRSLPHRQDPLQRDPPLPGEPSSSFVYLLGSALVVPPLTNQICPRAASSAVSKTRASTQTQTRPPILPPAQPRTSSARHSAPPPCSSTPPTPPQPNPNRNNNNPNPNSRTSSTPPHSRTKPPPNNNSSSSSSTTTTAPSQALPPPPSGRPNGPVP